MKLLRTGKVKEVYDAGSDELVFRFTDNISVFDKVIPTPIPDKGETLARSSTFWFNEIEKAGICKTHFIDLPKPTEMRVERVRVIDDYDQLTGDTTNFLIPLEVICRHYAAGSFLDRIHKNELDPEEAGLDHVPEEGEELPEPFIEFTTKLEKVDRPLTEKEALEISGLTVAELENIKQTVLRIDELISEHVSTRGLIHVDGKKEFAFDNERNLMLIDTFGTADEDRWWELEPWENDGTIVQLSKEFVRQHYRDTGYHKELYAARDAGEPEPDIPPLPEDIVDATRTLYVDLFERLTGQRFEA